MSEPGSGRRRFPTRAPTAVTSEPLHPSPSVLFAIGLSVDLEIAVLQHELAIATPEATDVVLPTPFVFKVLAFDTVVAASAETSVELVVMALAVRSILVDIKGG